MQQVAIFVQLATGYIATEIISLDFKITEYGMYS